MSDKNKSTTTMKLDTSNTEWISALSIIRDTTQSVYLTGKAGTGKTTFLKELKNEVKKKQVILAPTGVAAINAGGSTIHSFFKIKPSLYTPTDKRLRVTVPEDDDDTTTIYNTFSYTDKQLSIIRKLELLIIDEASMVRSDMLDLIDRILRVFRAEDGKILDVPFGGVQLLLIGDLFQLPPVIRNDEWQIMKQWYKSGYFFDALCYKSAGFRQICLTKVYRQSDQDFIDLLNRVRMNETKSGDLKVLNGKLNPSFMPTPSTGSYITLTTHNAKADNINEEKLGSILEKAFTFEAIVEGNFKDNIFPAPKTLKIKKGSQVMFLKNCPEKGYWNGAIGIITSIDSYGIKIDLDGRVIDVEKEDWENIEYTWNNRSKCIEERIVGSFTQYPIRLAWAITVHKSQGMTFDRAIVDLDRAFAPGQVYVALSRCTSLNGLILRSKINPDGILTDERVIEFSEYTN